jgi:hypothetical protein
MARERHMAVWFSAQTHRDSGTKNERGIPAPCHVVDDLFSVIILLEPQPDSIHLRLMKAYNVPVTGNLPIQLNPNTLLLMDR